MKAMELKELIETIERIELGSDKSRSRKEILDLLCEFIGFSSDQKTKLIAMGMLQDPASSRHHLAYRGGLFDHSLNVVKELCFLTDQCGLVWSRLQSPVIVGLLHDVCKLGTYKRKDELYGTVYEKTYDSPYFGHGSKSLMVIDDLNFKLNTDEKLCILHHMGAYEKDLWNEYDTAIKMCENVLWTHTADMYASKIAES